MRPVRAYIGVGANLGDRRATIVRAVRMLKRVPGVRVLRRSRLRRTNSVGAPGPDYLNGVVEVRCALPPRDLLRALLDIERRLGRERPYRWAPRTIDLDLLLYGNRTVRSRDLIVPHPRLASRQFVLEPLAELRPGLRVPGIARTVRRLLAEVSRPAPRGRPSWAEERRNPSKPVRSHRAPERLLSPLLPTPSRGASWRRRVKE